MSGWMAAGLDVAAQLADQLRDLTLRATVEVGGHRVSRTISAGVVPLSGSEGRARALMAAQVALRRAKKQGGNRVAVVQAPEQPNGPTTGTSSRPFEPGQLGITSNRSLIWRPARPVVLRPCFAGHAPMAV